MDNKPLWLCSVCIYVSFIGLPYRRFAWPGGGSTSHLNPIISEEMIVFIHCIKSPGVEPSERCPQEQLKGMKDFVEHNGKV